MAACASGASGVGRGCLALTALDRVTMGLPRGQPVGDPADVVETGGSQQRRGHTRPVAGRADRRDRPISRQVVEPLLEDARADVQRGRDVPADVFADLPDVDDERGTRAAPVQARRELVDREAAAGLDRGAATRSSSRNRRGCGRGDSRNRRASPGALASSQSAGESSIRTSGRSGSTTQPNHVPNDEPEGIETRPGHVGHRVGRRRAKVDEDRILVEGGASSLDRQRSRLRRAAAEQPRAGLVGRAHPREVAREGRLVAKQEPGKAVHVGRLDHRVVAAFEADRGPRRRGDAGRAERTRAVGRIDADEVLVRQDHLADRSEHRPGVWQRVVRSEEVGPADGADEQRPAGEQQERLLGTRRVGDGVGDVLGRVAGGLEGREAQGADIE